MGSNGEPAEFGVYGDDIRHAAQQELQGLDYVPATNIEQQLAEAAAAAGAIPFAHGQTTDADPARTEVLPEPALPAAKQRFALPIAT